MRVHLLSSDEQHSHPLSRSHVLEAGANPVHSTRCAATNCHEGACEVAGLFPRPPLQLQRKLLCMTATQEDMKDGYPRYLRSAMMG